MTCIMHTCTRDYPITFCNFLVGRKETKMSTTSTALPNQKKHVNLSGKEIQNIEVQWGHKFSYNASRF